MSAWPFEGRSAPCHRVGGERYVRPMASDGVCSRPHRNRSTCTGYLQLLPRQAKRNKALGGHMSGCRLFGLAPASAGKVTASPTSDTCDRCLPGGER